MKMIFRSKRPTRPSKKVRTDVSKDLFARVERETRRAGITPQTVRLLLLAGRTRSTIHRWQTGATIMPVEVQRFLHWYLAISPKARRTYHDIMTGKIQ